MQSAKKGILNVIYGLIGQILVICLGIVLPRLVMVNFGSEVNGLINTVNQIFIYFSLLEAGVGLASLQALYGPVARENRDEIQAIMSATHRFYKKTGIIYGVAVVILALGFPFFVKSGITYGTIAGVILFGGFANCINFFYQGKYKILMQAEGYNYISINITTLINVLANIAKAILIIAGCNILIVQFSYFVVNVLQMLIYSVYIKKNYSWIDFSVEPDNAAISQKNATLVHQISQMIFNNTDVLMLTLITKDLKIVSIYTMYNMIITYANVMIQQVENGFAFMLGQRYNTNKKEYYVLHHIFEILYMILVFAVMTSIYVLFLPFMRLYTAGITDIDYINSWYPLLFVLTPLLTYGRCAANNLINYAGHFEQTKWRAILESVINITVSVIGIWKFGIFGALMGTIVASLYRTNDIILYTYKHLMDENKPWKTYKRWAACLAVFIPVVVFVNNDSTRIASYGSILLYGAGIFVLTFAVYTLVQVLVNLKEASTAKKMICDLLKRRKDGCL